MLHKRRFIIYQSSLKGHRPEYVRHVVSYLGSEGYDAYVLIKTGENTEAQALFKDLPNIISISTGSLGEFLRNDPIKVRQLTTIVILDGDIELNWLIRNVRSLAQYSFEVLLMRMSRPVHLLDIKAWFALFVKYVLAFAISLFLDVRFSALRFLNLKKSWIFNPVRDPLVGPVASNQSTLTKPKILQVGLVGTIDPRKSVILAINATEKFRNELQLNLIGKVLPTFEATLAERLSGSPEVFLLDKRLTEEEFNFWTGKLDCLFFLQRTNAPSGTLLRALALGKHCIVGGAPTLLREKSAFPDQITQVRLSKTSIQSALNNILKNGIPSIQKVNPELFPSPSDFARDLLMRNEMLDRDK